MSDFRPRPNRWLRPALFGLAVVVVFLGAAATAVGIGWRLADTDPSVSAAAAPLETQMECTAIKREYASWNGESVGLDVLPQMHGEAAEFAVENAYQDGQALLKAVSGYPDQPAKALAVAVADYNYEVSMVNLKLTVSGKYADADYQTAKAAQQKVKDAYASFVAGTCS